MSAEVDRGERLLAALGELERQRVEETAALAADERWEAVCAGDLDEATTSWLAEVEAGTDGSRVAAAFRPLGGDFHARVAQAARGRLRPSSRRRSVAALWALPLAAGLALAVLALMARDTAAPPLPGYQLAVDGGDARQRSSGSEAAAATLRVSPGGRLSLILRPATAVAAEVEGALWQRGEGRFEPLGFAPQVHPGGTVAVEATVEELGLATGHHQLVLVAGRRGELPSREELATALAEGGSHDAWRFGLVSIEVQRGPPG